MNKRTLALAVLGVYAGAHAATHPQGASSILPHQLATILVDFNTKNIMDHALQQRPHTQYLQELAVQESTHACIKGDLADQAPVALYDPCLNHKNHIARLTEMLVNVRKQTYTTSTLNRLKGKVIDAIKKNIAINNAIYGATQRAVAHHELGKEVDFIQKRYGAVLAVFKEKQHFSDTEWSAYVATLAQEQASFVSDVETDLHSLTIRTQRVQTTEVPTSVALKNILTSAAEYIELLQNLQNETCTVVAPIQEIATN